MSVSSSKQHHVVLFPYMSKGHIIPLLQFSRLLLRHNPLISITVFTTPKNEPFVTNFLSNNLTSSINIISLPFPEYITGVPPGVESTDKLPSMSLYVPFTRATKSLQPSFEEKLKNLPQVSFIVSDGFLWWTLKSAAKFDIPRKKKKKKKKKDGAKPWCVGPLCLVDPPKPESDKPAWIQWLDRKREEGRSVLYVAFGTQAEVSDEQLKEIALGLEDSKVNYLWITRRDVGEIIGELGLEKGVNEHGMIVKDWVDQWEILSHESVKGFLSHCGWNSAQESICTGIPLLAWPMMAEQPLNAKLVVEELKIGVPIETEDGSVKGLVTRDELSRKVRELMEGEMGNFARKNVKEYAEMAKEALAQGTGSSWKNLDSLLQELCKSEEPNDVNKLSSDE